MVEPLSSSESGAQVDVLEGFDSHYLSGPILYVRRHITVKHVLIASLNKIFPSFFLLSIIHICNVKVYIHSCITVEFGPKRVNVTIYHR